jgi:hypothetical protein
MIATPVGKNPSATLNAFASNATGDKAAFASVISLWVKVFAVAVKRLFLYGG